MLRRNFAQVALAVLLGAFIGFGGTANTALGQAQTTPARAAIVIDLTSGAVLLEKNADVPIPPA